MKENIVSFQVAKLAKEKGFTLQTNPFGYVTKFYRPSTGTLLSYGRTGRSKLNTLIYAPTQSLLQKWLREVHNISICIYPVLYEWEVSLHTCYRKRKLTVYLNAETSIHGKTYEEALEVGLQEALKLIKNEN